MLLEQIKKLKAKKFANIYLLYGSEQYLLQEMKNAIIENVLEEHEHDFNLSSYDMEETSIDLAIEDAETLPFMGEKRVVIITNPFFLTAEKNKSKVEHNIDRFLSYIESPAPYTVFVILASYEKLDERKKIVKTLKKTSDVLEANTLNERDLKQWITQKAKEYGTGIEEDAAEELLKIAGVHLAVLAQEINKMAMYIGSGNITTEVVQKLAAKTMEHNVFELIESIVQRKIDRALEILFELYRNNEEPIKIHALLTNQFRLVYQVKDLTEQGYSQQKIASIVKVHPYRVKLAAQHGRRFSRPELMNLIDNLAEADYSMKSGNIDKRLAIELLLLKLANLK
ncbi:MULTISPECIES: DNA polymerase III subunit delta [Sutcliffiella]|uniref:DNA polymerase III subunit delta n=1 Tax=Sutcliffiella cohnii TaxID=33932 RepID=A0A223KTH1_9BACI|nr:MULTISPECIES: DNA polymerase III subunit delta [Sutcliffiella]AST92644.1 DNA polymerase III subunit delta [Sutcliffiella cohnii]MED4016465.1 DNA polymerase III subunit delta [Sutcliffiella cohnii]WBL13883.1 DNA polymerase III subunit delta [Sutcliffiella sp. NC1]